MQECLTFRVHICNTDGDITLNCIYTSVLFVGLNLLNWVPKYGAYAMKLKSPSASLRVKNDQQCNGEDFQNMLQHFLIAEN